MRNPIPTCYVVLLFTIVGVLWGKENIGQLIGIAVMQKITLRLCALQLILALSPGLSLTINSWLFIKSIDIGQLYSVRDTLCYDLEEEEKADGMYREVEQLLLSLAKFYLSKSRYQLIWFQGQVNTFHVSLGGDGAPFGKDDTACAWLVSLLNIGRGVLSSNENFLLFGANCKEDCVPVSRFLVKLVSDISEIEKNTYSVDCSGVSVDVKLYSYSLCIMADF